MAVNYTSRYSESIASDRFIALRKPRSTTQYRSYVAADWDTFDMLAHRLFGNAELYWLIADLNPQVPFPDRIAPGTELRLPL